MSKKIFSLISIFFLMLFVLVGCNDPKGTISIQVETEMIVGETYQVGYKLDKIDEKIPLTWKVSAPEVAELNSENLTIKALKAGTFTLTVTAKTGETASKTVTVVDGGQPSTKYTISYELNGGKASNAPTEYDGTKDVELPTPTKEGYNFAGWYESADFAGTAVTKIAVGSTGNKTFYAKWEAVQTVENYTITYEVNGGVLEGATTSYTAEDEVTLVTPTFAGYTFMGWYESADFASTAVTKIAVGSTGNKTFYAKWEEVEYTITFNAVGGTLENAPTTYTVESQDVVLPTPTKEGYNFLGWYESASFAGDAVTKIVAGSTGDKTFHAKWEAVQAGESAWTITYNLNGGSMAEAPTEYDGSETITLVYPIRRGYSFKGWYESADFAGEAITQIAAGSTGNKVLYAKWVASPYAIAYNLNGGEWGDLVPETSYTVLNSIVLQTPTKEGYNFLGWYKEADFSGTQVVSIAKGSIGKVTLYAKWEVVEYTITYNLNEGLWPEGVVADEKYTIEEEITLQIPTKERYKFVGWYETEDFAGEAVTVVATGSTGNKVLYAKWELAEYNVVYDLNGGQWGTIAEFTEEFLADFNTAAGLTGDAAITKDTMVSGTGSVIKTVIANEEFYNKYQKLLAFVSSSLLEKNEGSSGYVWTLVYTDSQFFFADLAKDYETAVITINTTGNFGAQGRTLLRHYLWGLINESITSQTDYQKVAIDFSQAENQSKFLDAWHADKSNVIFKPEDTLATPPVREGYNFLGWYLDGEKVETVTSDCTLVAEWEEIKYTVNFDLAGGLWADTSVDTFAEELVYDFNNTGNSGATATTTRENFKATSHPNIKYVFNQPEMLTKYKWFLEFALEEITAAATANDNLEDTYYKNTKLMLEGMISGDTEAVNINDTGHARTLFRFWVEGLINSKLPAAADIYAKCMVDYSVAANMARFLSVYQKTELQISSTATLPTPVRVGYDFLGWYLGEEKVEKVTSDCALVAKWEVTTFSISYDLNGGAWDTEEGVTEFEWNATVTLPTPVREGYIFLGWLEDSKYVEKIYNQDYALTAKWKSETQTGYEVIFDLNGGSWEENLDTFAEELVYDFNNTGNSEATATTTRENFKATSHPNIKYVFNQPEMLTKYKWFLEFALEEITAAATANDNLEDTYYKNTKLMLEGMISGDTEAVNINDGGNARTLFRFWVEGLINSKLPAAADIYAKCMVDYSVAANMARFEAIHCPVERTIEPTDELPVAVRENYIFAGWYLDGQKVEAATGDDVLVAEWIHEDDYEWEVQFDLNGGQFEGASIAKFTEEFLAAYNKAAGLTGDSAITKATISSGTATNIKTVVADATFYKQYQWLFEYAYEALLEKNADGVWPWTEVETSSQSFFGELAKDHESATAAINATGNFGSYGRTILRRWLYGLLNETLIDDANYSPVCIDYSEADNQAKFLAVYPAVSNTYTAKDTLPTPAREGYKFLGWYNGEELVEAVRGNWTLVARWEEIKYTISWDLAGGAWDTEEGVTEFKPGVEVTLPTPVRENYTFLGWYQGEELVTEITDQDYTLVAKWKSNIVIKYTISWDLAGGEWGTEEGVTEFEEDQEVTLPTPAKEGYKFKGWYQGEEKVTEIGNQDYTLVAVWEELKEQNTLTVDPTNADAYATIEAALADANDGDIIVVKAGNYEGVEINKSVVLQGANANINPNTAIRNEETIFTGDIVVAADDVTIDGIQLAGAGRIVGSESQSFSNLVVLNVLVDDSTITGAYDAPLYFIPTVAGVVYSNVYISNMHMTARDSRAMIMYGTQFNGLTIINSEFYGTAGSGEIYNDGLKINATKVDGAIDVPDCAADFVDIQGEVNITNNVFAKYFQYPVWFGVYGDGNYSLEGNTFDNSALFTSYNDACFTFNTYQNTATTKDVNINVLYNTAKYSGILARIQAAGLDATNLEANVNYNKIYQCVHTLFVSDNNKNSGDYINAQNNYYDVTPTASNFLGVSAWEPYYTDESLVPEMGKPSSFYNINYELDGGVLPEGTIEGYDSVVGLASLPTPTKEGYVFVGWYQGGSLVTSIDKGTEGDVTLTAKWREDAIYVGTGEDYYYATIAEALAVAEAGDKIIILAGEYTEDITVSVPNLTIVGPNEGIDPNTGTRVAEAVLKGVVNVTSAADNLTIDGLSFTADARVLYGESTSIEGFTFTNNKVYDTTEDTSAWENTRYVVPAFIQFRMTSGGIPSNFEISHNSFVNVSETNVLVNRAHNLSFNANVFKDFDHDAIRVEGGYAYGLFHITNNVFEQTTAGNGDHGIFFRSIAGASGTTTIANIINNTFIKLGSANGTTYTGAIGAHAYQENPLEWNIENNIFDHCYDYLYIRNNGATASIWSCTVENNQFLGLPTNQYYGSYNGSDTESTNPHLAEFTVNYYEDNNGAVITDLSAYASYFKHMASYGTTLSAKPETVEVTPLEFYTITYNLDGGTCESTLVGSYHSLISEAITLPTPTKPNHNFLGWKLNGEYVTEIDVESRGDLELVAEWQAYEGDFYNVTFVTEHGTWPSRDATGHEEIADVLMHEFYDWYVAQGKTTDDYATWYEAILPQMQGGKDVGFINNAELGKYPAEDGSEAYFFNIPENHAKWADFFDIFNEVVIAVNSSQTFYGNTYVGMIRLYEFVAWSSSRQAAFNARMSDFCKAVRVPEEIPTQYQGGQILELPVLTSDVNREFYGWYDNAEFTGEAITTIASTDTGDKTFYAKWAPEIIAESIEVNSITELKRYLTHQLEVTFNPTDTHNTELTFISSDPTVASIGEKSGLITAHKNGTTTITIKVASNPAANVTFDLTVWSPDYIDGSYETVSYVNTGSTINLIAEIVTCEETSGTIVWESLDPTIATVDENGKVTGVAKGTVGIVAKDTTEAAPQLVFYVTVLDGTESEVVKFLVEQNNSNVFTEYDLSIGGDRNEDIYSSVSKILFEELEINESKLETGNADTAKYTRANSGLGVEFITVHYTAGFPAGSNAAANASYFVSVPEKNNVSIHYTTGNDGIYHCLDDELYGAWHAGDSGSVNGLTDSYDPATGAAWAGVGHFKWIATGVSYDDTPLLDVVFSASDDFYYEINGKKTTVKLPSTYDYKSRGSAHIYNSDGTVSSNSDWDYTAFSHKPVEEFFNDQDFPITVIGGEYYMGTTWWSYGQTLEGRICSNGGNYNSIGIESCVNRGSDLWWTWQKTAKLVAKLMEANDLGLERVKGHHFFDGKNCPQPMLENDLEIWYEFLELTQAEYDLRTKYSDVEIEFVSNNTEIVNELGRVVKAPEFATSVSYTLTITQNGKTETITLASMIPGIYEK